MFGKILGVILRVEGGLPLPVCANFNEVIASLFELIGGKFPIFLKDVLLRRRTDLLAKLLRSVVHHILGHIPVVHL